MEIASYAHRGLFDNTTIFENTMPAFDKAIALNYGIELDVRMTKDKILVVYHDKDLKRLFGSNLMIKDLTYDALIKFNFKGTPIPTLSDVLLKVNGRVPLIIEIKEGHDRSAISYKTASLLDAYQGDFAIESFDPFILRWFKKNRRHFKRGQLVMPAHKYESYFLGVLMRVHITHLLVKPNFYAYEVTLGNNVFSRWWLYAFAKEIVLWTVKPDTIINLKHQSIIFEDVRLLK